MKRSNASSGVKSTRTVLRIASVIVCCSFSLLSRLGGKRPSASYQNLSKYSRIRISPSGSTR